MLEVGVSPRYLININAGAHDYERPLWKNRVAHVRRFAEEVGSTLITIDTNFHEQFRMPHTRCDCIRNLCANLALYPFMRNFVYSTAVALEEISFASAKQHGLGCLDPVLGAGLMPCDTSAILFGGDATRNMKITFIGEEVLAQKYLDVCTSAPYQSNLKEGHPRNCGQCSKCIRTMLTLDHFGKLDAFDKVFSVAAYRSARKELLAKMSHSNNPLDQESVALVGGRRSFFDRFKWKR